MTSKIQVRRDTHANWVIVNPTLSAGEIGFETDTGKFKIGNGDDFYVDLYYAALSPELGGQIHGNILMNNNVIKDLGSPTDPSDATTKTYVETSISNHNEETTSVHGIFDTAELATKTYASSAVSTHNEETTNIHGIADTDALATKTYASFAASDAVSTHNEETTNVHGIADTSALATKTYADAAAGTAQDNAEGFATTAISNHNSATTNVHGIANTSELATKTYADAAAGTAQDNAEGFATTAVSNHNSATTSVHGITDTSALATKTYADNAVSTHNSTTKSVHGITDTSALATKTYADVQAQGAESNSNDYTDGKISTEVTNRNTAISNAISTEVSDRNTAISNAVDSAINTEVSNRNSAISTAKGEAISTSEGYTDNQITNLVNAAPSTLDTLKELADALGSDPNFATSVSNSIATKLPKAGGTMSGNIAMGSNNITGLAAPSSDNDAATKKYVDDQTTTDIAEGTNLYFTDERAQDAVGNNVGAGLSYNDSLGEISNSGVTAFNTRTGDITLSDTDVNDALGYVAANATDLSSLGTNTANDIADAITTAETYTDTVVNALTTSDIEEGTNLYYTDERAQDAIGSILGTGLSYNDATPGIGINNAALSNYLLEGASGNSYGLIGTSTYLDVKNTNGYNKEIELDITAVESQLITDGFTKTSDIAELAQDAIGLNLGTGLSYNDSTGEIKVTPNTYDAYGAASTAQSNAEAYADALTTADIAENTNLYYTDERAQDAIGLNLGTGLSYNDSTGAISNTGVISLAGTSNQITASASTGSITLSLPNSVSLPGSLEVSGDTIIDGNLQVKGTTTTLNTATYSVQDNLIYMNAALDLDILGATHNTTTVEYKVLDNTNISVGMSVRITGITPSDYNISYADAITVVSKRTQGGNNYFTVTKTVTVSYTSGGVAHFKVNVDPDLGFAGGYYESGYAHAGLFRDASDSGTFKFFQGYTPEPDEAVNIDTTDASFAFAPLKASIITATDHFIGNITGNVTGTVSGNAGTVTNGVYTTDTGTVTNGMLAGSIANNKLSNSKITIGSTDISLGSSATTIAGLTSVTSTGFTGALTGNADTATKLATARNINGVSFDGSAAITVTAAAETLSGDTLASGVTTSSLTTVGTITSGTWSGTTIALNKGGTGATTQAGAANAILPTQTSNSGKYLTTDGTNVSWGSVSGYNAPTIGSTSIASGSTVTTIAGLSSVTSTSFVGALTGNASTVTNGVYTTDTGTVTNTMLAGSITPSKISGTAVVQTDLASNVLTFLGTPTSANLAAALTDETGSTSAPKVVFSNTPAITAPLISTKLSLYTNAYIEFEGSTLDANKTTLTVVDPTAARTITLPNATGTVVLKDSTDTLTNKTFDTAGTGNSFSINGTAISAVTGTGSAVLSASPTFTGTVGAAALTTTGNVIVGGDLTVNGTTTTVNSSTLAVADSNIEIAKVASPTDVTANGAGITVKGATDKTLNWYSSTSSFTSSENVDLASGKTYKIAGTTVLTGSTIFGKTIGGTSSGDIVDINTIQTLTNKTLTTPVIGSISNSGTITIPTGTDTLVGRNTTDTLTAKTLSTSCAVAYASGLTFSGSTGGTILQASNAASGTLTLPAPSVSDTLVGRATTDTLTNKIMGASATATTVSFNTATTVDTTALSGFTTIRYVLSIKQGSKIRSSQIMVQTDGTGVDSNEFAIIETGGKMTGIAVAASVSSTNMILTVTITDALTTNATVKLNKVLL